jgi:RNA polymerase sigma factor (sigma-70 family)
VDIPRVMPEDLQQILQELRAVGASPSNVALLQWLPRLRAMARRHLPPQSPLRVGLDSEDLLQEGLLHLVRNVDQFRGATWGEFLKFVHSILAQKKGQQFRRQQVRARELAPAAASEDLAEDGTTPSVDAMAAEDRRRVRQLVLELPEPYRTTMELRLAGLSNEELAQRLGLGAEALRQRLSRAVRMLKERWS